MLHRQLITDKNDTKQKCTVANKVLPKAGLNGFDWTFVQNSTVVLRLNFSANNPRLRQAPDPLAVSLKDDTPKEKMTVELIPVIEIGYHNQDITAPDKYPYWKHPELWDKFNSDCYKKAGFKDELKPYLAGSSFYRLPDITDINLTKVITDHTQELRDGKYGREQASALFGGYVLRIDGQDKYFPQCCGDLADIQYWENLANGKEKGFYAGHPEPQVKIHGDNITFDFTVDEFDEHFAPTPIENIIQFDILSLKKAIETVKTELDTFEQRLERINKDEKLNIDNIVGLLIWDNANYE